MPISTNIGITEYLHLTKGAWVLEGPGPAPKGPLVKGGWHGAAVTGGFFYFERFRGTESPRPFGAPPFSKGGLGA